jgi:hypothetical protein
MSWNETFYWLAILSLALALAQFGVSGISPTFYKAVFRREPNVRLREVMKVSPNFLTIVSIMAFLAGLWLIIGLAANIALAIAAHFGYSDNFALMTLTLVLSYSFLIGIAFIMLRTIWRAAARLPSRNLDTEADVGTINAEIQRRLKEIREGKPKTRLKV